MQNFNLHTHTYRCKHATGTEEEILLAAIEAGFKVFGFSEHLPFEDWDSRNSRINLEEVDDYIATINALKEKYQNQIEVYCGFETEYFSDQKSWLEVILKKCDYLILGQHSYFRGDKECWQNPYCQIEHFKKNAEMMIEGIESGYFTYVAHPDYVLLSGNDLSSDYLECFKEIAKAAKKAQLPIEINLKGTRQNRKKYGDIETWKYPNQIVMEIFKQAGCQFVFGYDVHSIEMVQNRKIEEIVRKEFESLKLDYIEDSHQLLKKARGNKHELS